jgi:hypothetical protein
MWFWYACGEIHNLYAGTVSEHNPLMQASVVLLLRHILKGEAVTFARRLRMNCQAALWCATTSESRLRAFGPRWRCQTLKPKVVGRFGLQGEKARRT